jgi:hypothetical protein
VKPPIVQLLKNFAAFYGTRRFITAFTRALHWSLFLNQMNPVLSILILSNAKGYRCETPQIYITKLILQHLAVIKRGGGVRPFHVLEIWGAGDGLFNAELTRCGVKNTEIWEGKIVRVFN